MCTNLIMELKKKNIYLDISQDMFSVAYVQLCMLSET